RLLIIRGSEPQTRGQVEAMLASLPADSVAWIAEPHELARRLGRAFGVGVVGAHAGSDADVLGQAHGLLFGGGALVPRMGLEQAPPDPRLAASPYTVADVGRRFASHVEQVLERCASPAPSSLGPADRTTAGTV